MSDAMFSDWSAKDVGCVAKGATAAVVLAGFWAWESLHPWLGHGRERWRHGARNLALALVNTAVLALVFGSVTVLTDEWTQRNRIGLLHLVELDGWAQIALGILLLDGWMYVWHRANHVLPLLWRFHRVHHSDTHMDVTSATRFHLGEHIGSATLRLGVIPLLGIELWTLVIYETLVIAVTHFHHADISLGRADGWLRWLIVTPNHHKVHHSDWQPETDSNYATVFSFWDRLLGTWRTRNNLRGLQFGLEEFAEPVWQRWWSLWKMPFTQAKGGAIGTPRAFPRSDPKVVRYNGTGLEPIGADMSVSGTVRNGVVVLEATCDLPEGTKVEVIPKGVATAQAVATSTEPTLGFLLKYAGTVTDWPADMAKNHDHYLYGAAKK